MNVWLHTCHHDVKRIFKKIEVFKIMNDFSMRLLELRLIGESERHLAARLGIDWTTYMRWKAKEQRPNISIRDIEKIAFRAGVSPAWLAFGDRQLLEQQRVAGGDQD